MKSTLNKAKWILICIMLVLFATGGFAVSIRAETAETVESVIQRTLEKLEASDAEYIGKYEYDTGKEGEYILFYSQTTDMEYSFDPESGALIGYISRADNSTPANEDGDSNVYSQESGMTEEDLRAYVLDYVESHLPFDLFGNLIIEFEHFSGLSYHYTIREMYNEMETGTVIYIDCNEDGSINYCVIKEGTIFRKNNDGTYSLINGTDFIGEEAAVEKAHEYFAAVTAEHGRSLSIVEGAETIEMKAQEDKLYYLVTVDGKDETGWVWNYFFEIDVYTGEMLSAYYS